MADKKITELSLRSNVSDDVNWPVDDTIQSYRVTATQIKDYVLAAGNVLTAAIGDLQVTTGKIAAGAVTRAKLALGAIANSVTSTKTTTFTAANTDDIYICDTSGGAYTATLPDAAANAGKIFTFTKSTSDYSALTIAAAGSDTIDGGANTTINTQGETIVIVASGTAWVKLNRIIPANVQTFTPPSYNGIGTPTNVELKMWRQGGYLGVQGVLTSGTATASECRIGLPTGLTSPTVSQGIRHCGIFIKSGVATVHGGTVLIESAQTYMTFSVNDIIGAGNFDPLAKANGNAAFNSSTKNSINALVPIAGWNG